MCDHAMPRTARFCLGGYTYRVLNRANARGTVFHKPGDYDAFVDLMAESSLRIPMRVRVCAITDAARAEHRPPRHTLGGLWVEGVNAVTGDIDLEAIRESVRRDRPFRDARMDDRDGEGAEFRV
jgi:hypothetical protein